MWVQIPPGANFFRCRYKKIHIFPAKYRPYAFLLWADTRNVVAPSPARTVWVQIPPGANFFRCRYKKIHLYPAKYTPYAFLLWAHTRNVVEPSPAQTPKQCGFKSHQVPTFSGVSIRKYTFFRPNIDHMPFCYFIDIINFHTAIGMKPSTAD